MNWRNDIDVAVEKIKQVTPAGSPWEAGDLGVGSSAIDYHIAVIINAVVSGDLAPIEAAEARIRELERGVQSGLAFAESWVEENGGIDGCDYSDRVVLENLRAIVHPTDLADRIKGGDQ